MQNYKDSSTIEQEINSSGIIAHARELLAESQETVQGKGIFIIKKGNQWLVDASSRPTPMDLYLRLWYQYELCFLFADTNVGKSILAVQMAVAIAAKMKVLYIDFELSDKQFENRNSNNYQDHYVFPENFFRCEIDSDRADFLTYGFASMEDYYADSIEKAITETGATVLIIDNLTFLGTETEKAKYALPLMKHLKALKKKLGLSILCLAHTPKRDLSKPITVNDLAGSKMLMNFCDSAFTIGQSTQDQSLRYIKQIKARETEIIYGAENVAVYSIVKPHNYLHFEFRQYSTERDHLKQLTEKDKQKMKETIIELHQADKNKSLREIGKAVGCDHMRVDRTIKEWNNCNKV